MFKAVYNEIGKDYNVTRHADPFLTSRLFQFLQPSLDMPYLDIGCGTGNYTIALAQHGLKFYGVEPSEKMLNKASLRAKNIKWLLGSAEEIPVSDNTFAGAIAVLTFSLAFIK